MSDFFSGTSGTFIAALGFIFFLKKIDGKIKTSEVQLDQVRPSKENEKYNPSRQINAGLILKVV
jgi:hypothetical protein